MSDTTTPPQPEAPAPAPHAPAAKKGNTLGLIGFILALVGFVLAVVPATAGVAWVLLIPAIVLSIIGLTRKGQPKGLSIAGVIIAPIAWLIAIIVAIAGFASGFGEGFESTLDDDLPSAAEPADTSDDEATPAEEETSESAADGRSIESALPFGTVVPVDSWAGKYEVSFGAIEWDATATIEAENMFNAEPAEGMKYLMVPVTITNTDSEEWSASGTFFWGDIKLVADGRGFSEGAIVVAPGDLSSQGDVYPGGTATGNVVFEVPLDTSSGVWDVDGVFVAAQ